MYLGIENGKIWWILDLENIKPVHQIIVLRDVTEKLNGKGSSLHKLGEYYDDILAAKCKKADSLYPCIEF